MHVRAAGRPLRLGGRGRGLKHTALVCATGATALGFLYLGIGGAPAHYLIINGAALLLGIALYLSIRHAGVDAHRVPAVVLLLGGFVLLATAFFGESIGSATRWMRLGPLTLQPAAILVPAMVVTFAARSGAVATIGMIVAAIGLAFQPDRALAGALAAGLAAIALLDPSRTRLTAVAAAGGAFVSTALRPDRVAPAPFVEQVFASAFEVHATIGIAVVIGAVLLLVPAILGAPRDARLRRGYIAFGLTWLAIVLAAVLGNYPTPLVGYGSSALLGYLLSAALLPDGSRRAAGGRTSSPDELHCSEKGP